MAVLKLSQITSSPSNVDSNTVFVGVETTGPTDYLFTPTQMSAGIPITISTTPIVGGTPFDVLIVNGANNVSNATIASVLDLIGGTQGDILYRGATTWSALTPGTSGQFLKTQGAAANPIWATATAGAGGANTQVQFNSTGSLSGDASFTYAGNGAVTIGTSGHTGSIALTETGGNAVTITPTASTGAWTFKLPTSAGTNTYVLTTDGSGNTSWVAPGSTANLVVGTSTITGGTTAHVVYDNGGVVGEASQFTIVSGQPNISNLNAYFINGSHILATADTPNGNWWFGDSGNGASVTGQFNCGFGNCLQSVTGGTQNMAMGGSALASCTSGSFNVAIGTSALRFDATPSQSIAIGRNALTSSTASLDNIAIGYLAMSGNTVTGSSNLAMGSNALKLVTSGGNNFALGNSSLVALTTGSNSVAIGSFALQSDIGAGGNIAIGFQAGFAMTTGNQNLILGYFENTITTGAGNISIGNQVGVASATASNQLVIGNYIYGTGLSGTGSTISSGKIGIGIKAPSQQLEVAGNCIIDTDLIVGTGTATNATSGFLYVDSGAGTPTGTPSGYTGTVPMYIDTTNSQLWLYLGGAWKQPKTPAGAALITWQ